VFGILANTSCSTERDETPANSLAEELDSQADLNLAALARRTIAKNHTTSTVVNIAVESASFTGKHVATVVYRENDVDMASVVDASGTEVATEEFARQDHERATATFGKLSPGLFEQLAALEARGLPLIVEFVTPVTLSEPSFDSGPREDLVDIEEYDKWRSRWVAETVRLINVGKQGARAWLHRSGGEVIEDSSGAPVISARIAPAALRSLATEPGIVLARLPEHPITHLDGDYAGHASMNYSPPTGYLAWGVNCVGSCDGGKLTVGISEDFSVFSGIDIDATIAKNNLRLRGVTYPNALVTRYPATSCSTDTDCDENSGTINQYTLSKTLCRALNLPTPPATTAPKYCVAAHPTYVAAAIGSYGVYSYNTDQPDDLLDNLPNVPANTTFDSSGAWNVRHRFDNSDSDSIGAHITFLFAPSGPPETSGYPAAYVNRSAAPTSSDYDWALRAYGVLMTHAQGNGGAAAASDCGLLRNVLCVGSYNYNTYNSISTHQISSFSSTGNPSVLTSLERPHLLGPGSHTEGSGLHVPSIGAAIGSSTMLWIEHWLPSSAASVRGTSFAAPAVLGVAIQAHQYEGLLSALAFPVVTKAVILASTVDIQSATSGVYDGKIGSSNTWFPQPSDAADGGGQINSNYTKQILDNNYYAYSDVVNSQFVSCGANCREYVVASVAVPAGQSLRVALAFSSCTSMGNNPTIANDFDLVVTAPGNLFDPCTKFISSASVNSEVEMVETNSCLAAKTHTIRLRIKNGAQLTACPGFTTERVGVAWSRRAV